jgi:hypothetical protein
LFGKSFPIVIGGHDHEPYNKTIQGSWVLKTGMNADNTAIIDITWKIDDNGALCSRPEIKVDMVPTKTYASAPKIEKCVRGHECILLELEQAKIFQINQWWPENYEELFSTQNYWIGPSNGSQAFCTLLHMSMCAQCYIVNSGTFCAGKVHPKIQEWFTWSDLETKFPFPSNMMCALEISGHILEGVTSYSQRMAQQDPPVALGCNMQHCDQIEVDDENQKTVKIQGESVST